MPVTPTYPGVYIEEIPSGVHPITGVATSIAAFIDFFPMGPLDTAVQVLSQADFERSFGGLNTDSEASYAIQQFFLNGGSEAYVVRVGDGSAITSAGVVLLKSPPSTDQVATVTAGTMVNGISVHNPGAWGNSIRLDVDYDTLDPTQLFNLTAALIDPATGQTVRSETFRNLTFKPGASTYAPDVVNQGSQLIQLGAPPSGAFPDAAHWNSAYRPAETGTVGDALPTTVGTLPADKNTFKVTVSVDGTIANNTKSFTYIATISLGGATLSDYASIVPVLQAAIRAAPVTSADQPTSPQLAAQLAPLLSGATVQLVGSGSMAHFRVVAGRGGTTFNPLASITFDDVGGQAPTIMANLKLKTATSNVQLYSLGISGTIRGAQLALTGTTGVGANGSLPGANQLIGIPANKTGLFALEDVDLFNILCIPRAANLDTAAPWSNFQAVISAANAYCQKRRAFMAVDIPAVIISVPAMQTWMAQNDTLRDINSAIYFPRTMIPDPLNGNRLRDVASSGTIAGLYALTDVNRGVWKAPAGTEAALRNVSQLVYKLTDDENGVLNPLGINSLRNFPVFGNVCWGARTLDGADVISSDWKYIPVRRLALFLEESLYRGLKWVVFEPNDEPLWAQIRLNVTAFMQNLFRQGAFQGSTPQQAYLVKCDSETTTTTDQANGIVNIVVGFAPLKPAEFVIIKIRQLAGQLAA
jgi:phage tail sheath protein FI